MLELLFIVAMFITGVTMIKRDNKKNAEKDKWMDELMDKADSKRDFELYRKYYYQRKEVDGTPIPKDLGRMELLWLVDKQRRKEGARLHPVFYYDYYQCIFSQDGKLIGKR